MRRGLHRRPTRICGAILVSGVLAACGIDQGGVRIEPAATTRTTLVQGPITGFGSVLVNGLRLETTGVTVHVDGVPGAVADLRVGQMIRAVAAPQKGGLRALVIEQNANVVGPVTGLDPVAGALTVLGLEVSTDAGTSFDVAGLTALTDLADGDVVRVSGFATPTGAILATYIGRADPGDAYQITGTITAADPASLRFHIGDLEVDYSQAGILDVAAGMPAAGMVVAVTGTALAGDVLVADAVRGLALVPGRFDSAATALTDVERPIVRAAVDAFADAALAANFIGFITAVNPPGRITLGDVDVLIRAGTTVVGGTTADLVVGARVQIEGDVSTLGQIEAARIRIL